MIELDPNRLHRTVKVELDEGRATSLEEAREIAGRYVLQIDVADSVLASPTRQAMLLTAINAGRRAFLGGVQVRIGSDGPTNVRWAHGLSVREAVEFYGGAPVETLDVRFPTIVIG